MTQLGKYEKYLIEEFFDDYRSGALVRRARSPSRKARRE